METIDSLKLEIVKLNKRVEGQLKMLEITGLYIEELERKLKSWRGLLMSIDNYNKCMAYLDVIEAELNKIALMVGHCSYEEFIKNDIYRGV